jgi:hypothetical protein
MQRVWTNRNVDLALLKQKVQEFFQDNDFDTVTSEYENVYHLAASGSSNYTINGQIEVTIRGTPQDILVELEHQSKGKQKKYSMPMTLTIFMGAGILLRDEFKSDEAFLKLKKDFWTFLDRTVNSLTNSAETS